MTNTTEPSDTDALDRLARWTAEHWEERHAEIELTAGEGERFWQVTLHEVVFHPLNYGGSMADQHLAGEASDQTWDTDHNSGSITATAAGPTLATAIHVALEAHSRTEREWSQPAISIDALTPPDHVIERALAAFHHIRNDEPGRDVIEGAANTTSIQFRDGGTIDWTARSSYTYRLTREPRFVRIIRSTPGGRYHQEWRMENFGVEESRRLAHDGGMFTSILP